MYPDDHIFKDLINFLWMFIGTHISALIIVGILIGYSIYLHKKFSDQTHKYDLATPPESYFLNLQCKRWERHAYQVCLVLSLSIIMAFIIFLFFQMTISASKETSAVARAGNISTGLIVPLRIILYIGLISFKTRALLDIHSVLKDLERTGL
jgi:hypothetical protein